MCSGRRVHDDHLTGIRRHPGGCHPPRGCQNTRCLQKIRNELEKLVENDIIGSGWCFSFAHNPAEWQGIKPGTSPTFPFCRKILWDACEMKSLTATSLIIALSITLPSCMTVNRMKYAAAKSSASRGVNHALVAKAGWKMGQVYKTIKPGGVVDHGGFLSLVSPATNSFVETALGDSSRRPPTVERTVPVGTLFQVVSFETTGAFDYFQLVNARQITGTSDLRIVDITGFQGKLFNERVVGEEYGDMWKRDTAYLVPITAPQDAPRNPAE